jgi:hypothetical protein
MRPLFTIGFWASLAALAVITLALMVWTRDDETAVVDAAPGEEEPVRREIDLIAPVFLLQADDGFDIVRGRTTAAAQIRVDGFRFMNIAAGTEGENRCAEIDQLAKCAVVADLLGDAVLWFSIVPIQPRNEVYLPPIVALREESKVQLDNGWIVRRAERVVRECDRDTSSLSDFVRREGEGSTTVFSVDEQLVTEVRCTVVAIG